MIKQVSSSLCNLFNKPNKSKIIETQLLFGEQVTVLKKLGNWLYCKSNNDGYLGWINSNELGPKTVYTHIVSEPICHCYKKNDIKSGISNLLYFNSRINVIDIKGQWFVSKINNEVVYIYKKHLKEIKNIPSNWVNYALKFQHAPYQWGGKSILGIDCSGLVQILLNFSGISFPRNTKEQFNFSKLKSANLIKKGSLVFWEGHVAIALDKHKIIHSNAHHLSVRIEKLHDVKERIQKNYGKFKGIKHLI